MSETFRMKDTKGEDKDFEPIADGKIYEAEVVSVGKVVKPWKTDEGEEIVRVEFGFKILDDDNKNRHVWGDTPTTFTTHPDCKMRAWVQEILAVNELPKDFVFETESVIGLHCRIAVSYREWADKVTGEMKWSNRVGDVIRSRDALAASVPAPVAGEVF